MVCGVELVPVTNWNNGLLSVVDCSSMRSPLWWNAWMKNFSYGMSLAVSCNGFNGVIVSARMPYSWMVGYVVHKPIGGHCFLCI